MFFFFVFWIWKQTPRTPSVAVRWPGVLCPAWLQQQQQQLCTAHTLASTPRQNPLPIPPLCCVSTEHAPLSLQLVSTRSASLKSRGADTSSDGASSLLDKESFFVTAVTADAASLNIVSAAFSRKFSLSCSFTASSVISVVTRDLKGAVAPEFTGQSGTTWLRFRHANFTVQSSDLLSCGFDIL